MMIHMKKQTSTKTPYSFQEGEKHVPGQQENGSYKNLTIGTKTSLILY